MNASFGDFLKVSSVPPFEGGVQLHHHGWWVWCPAKYNGVVVTIIEREAVEIRNVIICFSLIQLKFLHRK